MSNDPTDFFVALLRGINVGGKNKLPMAELTRVCQDLGCREVRTYIQSGNVVFRAEPSLAAGLPEAIEGELAGRLGLKVPVVLRSAAELRRVSQANPWPDAEPRSLHLAFLAAQPTPQALAKLDPERSPGDQYKVVGRDIFLFLPDGVARTKLSNDYFDRTLRTVSTVRNWTTVMTLLGMVERA